MIKREEQKKEDTWNIEALFSDASAAEAAIAAVDALLADAASFEGSLGDIASLSSFFEAEDRIGMLMEKIGAYAYMRTSQDGSDPQAQSLMARYVNLAGRAAQALSFAAPELMGLAPAHLKGFADDPRLESHKVFLKKLMRERRHILSKKEERIMSLQSPVSSVFSQGFDDLTDVDFRFRKVNGKELTASTFPLFLHSSDRNIRKKAYQSYYREYDRHKHVLARLYEGCVRQSVFEARARGFKSVLEKSLYADDVPKSVYANLISAAQKGFESLYRFYSLKRRALRLKRLEHYDVYAPLVPHLKRTVPYADAAEIVRDALSPLGDEYCRTLYKGLTSDRWVDRFENEHKASGAYSNGSYQTLPYIMMSYKADSYRDVFTLAHEGGHSMHTLYSARNNPFSCYSYSIFEAEVASTFNERLLSRYLYRKATSDEERLYLLASEADDIVATFFRQTMFATFEMEIFLQAQQDRPVTLDVVTEMYSKLLRQYFGSEVSFDMPKASLEALRIPHFYRPFYVYKYATGITAAQVLCEKVLSGGESERDGYLAFLKRGGSLFPLENLRLAGCDLSDASCFDVILSRFSRVLDSMEAMLLS